MPVDIVNRSSCRDHPVVWMLKICESDYLVILLDDIVIVKTKLRFGHPA